MAAIGFKGHFSRLPWTSCTGDFCVCASFLGQSQTFVGFSQICESQGFRTTTSSCVHGRVRIHMLFHVLCSLVSFLAADLPASRVPVSRNLTYFYLLIPVGSRTVGNTQFSLSLETTHCMPRVSPALCLPGKMQRWLRCGLWVSEWGNKDRGKCYRQGTCQRGPGCRGRSG